MGVRVPLSPPFFMTIWVAEYCTESSDRGVVGYWTKKPTEAQLKKFFKKMMPYEWVDGAPTMCWELTKLSSL